MPSNKDAILILVCGGSGSGKTTISQAITKALPKQFSSQILCQDQYYKHKVLPKNQTVQTYNFDHPQAFDFNLLYENLVSLIKRKDTNIPQYDYVKSARKKEPKLAKATDVIILEGILALYDPRIRDLATYKIFVDTPEDERFIRRLIRDKKERGRSDESIIGQWRNVVRPMYKTFIEPQKELADIIIPWYQMNKKALIALNGAIKELL